MQLIATIDWLMVLYNASDVLHNGIDVAGLELDHSFIPRVFYSSVADKDESAFAQEAADFRLGLGLNASDKVRPVRENTPESTIEGDVPVWEHNKRGDRYTIKPLIQYEHRSLVWGAAAVESAARIWRQSLINGYMPADFDWPHVKVVIRDLKQYLEERLEATAAAVLARATPFAKEGIDFKDKFPALSFDDVGDFDGLAFWPELNCWVTVECKYNQPAFCLKDARRLRDRIFGTPASRQQFAKIERRRSFLRENLDRIRLALGWPAPVTDRLPRVHELYVSRDIYWWMRNPPYPLPTQFVRVDSLDGWLRSNLLLA